MATLPVSSVAVSSGDISRDSPRASRPPMAELAPCLDSSATTWMFKTVPAARAVITTIKKLPGPASSNSCIRSLKLTRPRAIAVTAWPPINRLASRRVSQRGIRGGLGSLRVVGLLAEVMAARGAAGCPGASVASTPGPAIPAGRGSGPCTGEWRSGRWRAAGRSGPPGSR